MAAQLDFLEQPFRRAMAIGRRVGRAAPVDQATRKEFVVPGRKALDGGGRQGLLLNLAVLCQKIGKS